MPPVVISHRRSASKTTVAAAAVAKATPGPRSGGAQMAKPAATVTKREVKDVRQVWIDYKKSKDEALRNTLMENYLHLVRYNAERIHVKLPDEVELDDLMSAGIF